MTEGQSIGHTEAMFPGARLYFGHHCKPEQPVSFHEVRVTGDGGAGGRGEPVVLPGPVQDYTSTGSSSSPQGAKE